MTDVLDTAFPGSIVTTLKTELARTPMGSASVTADPTVVGRPLRPTDPNGTIAVYSADWMPTEWEIGNRGEPTLSRFNFGISYLIKHADEEQGRLLHSAGSKTIRAMLYRDQPLGVALRGLSDSLMGIEEKVQRHGVTRQEFRSNEIRGQFTFVSHLGLWVEVEARG